MPELACINGSFCPLADARVSVEDRGFQFADGVYEVVAAPGGRPFLLDAHLDRLRRSLAGIELNVDVDALQLDRLIAEGIRQTGYRDVLVYMQITGGVAPRNHRRPDECPPNLVMTFRQHVPVDRDRFERGVALESTDDMRWARPCIKSIALLPNILHKQAAMQRGFDDALLLGPGNVVRETTCGNVFAVMSNSLWTPPVSDHILRGITRDVLLIFAAKQGIATHERDMPLAELLDADEVFVTSTTQEAMPVIRIDQRRIGDGRCGPITRRCAEALQSEATAGGHRTD